MIPWWQLLTVLEGFGLGVSRLFFALGGGISRDFSYILFLGLCAGCVQMIVGFLWAISRTGSVRSLTISGLGHTLGPLGLGFFGLIANGFAFAAFQRSAGRADMTAVTFLSSLPGIILAAVFGWFFFREKFGWRQGVGLALAGYGALLTIPLTFNALWKDGIPIWVWLSLGTVLFATGNEIISKWMSNWEDEDNEQRKKLAPWTLQFWGGMAMVLTAGSAFFMYSNPHTRNTIFATMPLWWYGIGAGACNVFWWSCRQFAYQGRIIGTSIEFEKAPVYMRRFPAIGMALFTAMVVGAVKFQDPFTLEKMFGILIYIPAYFFAQNGSEKIFTSSALYQRFLPSSPPVIPFQNLEAAALTKR